MANLIVNTLNPFERIARNIENAVYAIEQNEKYPTCTQPNADIIEVGNKYNVILELPGMSKSDVSLAINDDNILTVKGTKKSEPTDEHRTFYRYERAFGTFQRKFALPDDADREHIKAKFEKGLLNIEIPQKETHTPKEIEIPIS